MCLATVNCVTGGLAIALSNCMTRGLVTHQ